MTTARNPGLTTVPPTENRVLYEQGRSYARRVERGRSLKGVAEEDGEGLKEVRTAYDFARDVDAIAAVAPAARELILDSEHPHLTPSVVGEIRGRSDQRVRTAVNRAAEGHHPFAPPPPADWGGDRSLWHFDLHRLERAGTLLERLVAVAERPRREVSGAARASVVVHATAIGATLDALGLVTGTRARRPSVAGPLGPLNGPSEAVDWAARARALVEGATGDLLRAAHTLSLAPVRDDLARILRTVAALAERVRRALPSTVAAVAPPGVVADAGGPRASPGTYVVVLRVERACVVRFARLGTFWFPAGYLLYVGSGFGAGGVAARAGRHLSGTGPRVWGVDHLRGVARPVGLWWTHHTEKLECTWARALAGLPCFCCPAPLAGASDCTRHRTTGTGPPVQRCPAHLFHATGPPAVADFAGQLGRSGSGGYEIHVGPAAARG